MPEPQPPRITVRPMTEGDLGVTTLVRKAALESTLLSEGRMPEPWVPRDPVFHRHLLRTDPAGSFVAEIEGIVVGYSQALVRGDIWYLAQLFVQPEVHALGVGARVLDAALQYADARHARTFAVCSTASPSAQALYLRSGMMPVALLYTLRGPLAPLLELPAPDGVGKRVVDCEGWQDRLAAVDHDVWGAERRDDHALFARSPEEHGVALLRDGEVRGYAWGREGDGWLGPVAARTPEEQLGLLRMLAETLLERGTEDGGVGALSTNPAVLRALLRAGWRIVRWTHFCTSAPFGQLDRYVPGSGFML
jgi:GNAT superfamily N-acetyltransferase